MQTAMSIHFEAPRLLASLEAPAQVTLLCADVVGFTRMSERLGDRLALCVMRQVARAVRAEVAACGAELIEVRGDSFLLAFGDPAASLACALRIQAALERGSESTLGERVRLRMAVHSGEALRDGGGYFGRNVIVPFRLLDRVEPGGIAFSEAAAARLPAGLRGLFGELERFQPKGMCERVGYARLEAADLAGDAELALRPGAAAGAATASIH
jgi:class 3 adenylate cyclase